VVPRKLPGPGVALAGLAAAEVAVVVLIAHRYGTDGALSTIVALVLAPVAVLLTAALARRSAGRAYAVAAAAVYVVLPLLASRFMLPAYRPVFDREALPDLVGLRGTGWFALGLLVTAVLAFAPRRAAAAAGVVAALVAFAVWGTGGVSTLRGDLHETAWSITLLEWLLVAGVIGLARRDPWRAAAAGGWIVALALHAAHEGYGHSAFWQSLSAGAPTVAVLLSALGLLVPPLRARTARPVEPAG
jgi:hypothetical protein